MTSLVAQFAVCLTPLVSKHPMMVGIALLFFLNDCEAVNFGQKSLMEGTFENLLADRRRKQREKLSPHGFHALFGAGVLRSSTGTGQNKGGGNGQRWKCWECRCIFC